ncbi:MAG: hypothetical protein RR185_00410 [Angelakisella sp.]
MKKKIVMTAMVCCTAAASIALCFLLQPKALVVQAVPAAVPVGMASGEAVTVSEGIAAVRQTDPSGELTLDGETVTVQGVALVDTMKWHDGSNYFALMDENAGICVFARDIVEPAIRQGDQVEVTGILSNVGYSTDPGTAVLKPERKEDIRVLSSGNPLPAPKPVYTDLKKADYEKLEGSYVTVFGQLQNYDNEGTSRGFDLDGSADAAYADSTGTIHIKFYSYAGFTVDGYKNGDWVALSGVVLQTAPTPEQPNAYYIRPTRSEDIRRITADECAQLAQQATASKSAGGDAPVGDAVVLTIEQTRERDDKQVLTHNNQIVTVEGTATVDSGKWHNNGNYFSLVNDTQDMAITVYLIGSTEPHVMRGDRVRVTGRLNNFGYTTDINTAVVKPDSSEAIQILSSGNPLPEPAVIFTDAGSTVGEKYEGMPVTIFGQVYDRKDAKITWGFDVDGSRDGNYGDKLGLMKFKFYSYAGISIKDIKDGDLVAVTGMLIQGEPNGDYLNLYYVRPERQEDVKVITAEQINDYKKQALILNAEDTGENSKGYVVDNLAALPNQNMYQLSSMISTNGYPYLDALYPVWGKDSQTVYFTLGQVKAVRRTSDLLELYTICEADKGEAKRLFPESNDKVQKQQVALSPDGNRILFAAAKDIPTLEGSWDIYATDLDSYQPQRLIVNPAYDTSPSCTPDGKGFVYRSYHKGNWCIKFADAHGNGETVLLSGNADYNFPAVSPDGSSLAFACNQGGNWNIWVSDGKGQNPRQVTKGQTAACCTYPAWSPDGKTLAYMTNQTGSWDIRTVAVDGTEDQAVTSADSNEKYPGFSPDGTKLVYASDHNGEWNVWYSKR